MTAPVQPPTGTGPKRPAKAGAMTMAMRAAAAPAAGPKVLRIGVLQSGRIIEERVIRRRETVTIGTSERNHFTVQAQALPGRFELFQLVGSDYILNFTEAMEGRVGLPSGVQDLVALRTSGGARNVGSHWQVKLTEQSRGKVSLGGVTFLFQFVTPPPVQPRPALPAAVVGGAATVIGVDWMFTAFVVFSFLCHFGFVIYLDNADWPLEQGVDAVPDSVARLILQEPDPPPRPPEPEAPTAATDQAATTDAAEAAAAQTKQRSSGSTRRASSGGNSGDTRGSPGENNARIREQAAAQAQALLLGAFGGQGGSAIQDVLRGGAVTSEAADVFAQTRGIGVAQGGRGGTLRQRSGGGTGGGGAVAGDLGSLRRTEGGGGSQIQEGAGGAPQERVIRGRATAGGMRDEGGSGTLDEGAARRALAGGARCVGNHYSRYLTQTRDRQRYTLRVSLTVTASGGVSGVSVDGAPNSDLQSRASSCFRGIRMPPPEGGSVEVSVPIVLSPPADM